MTLGTWVDGAPGQVGTWTATPGVPFDEVLIDHVSATALFLFQRQGCLIV